MFYAIQPGSNKFLVDVLTSVNKSKPRTRRLLGNRFHNTYSTEVRKTTEMPLQPPDFARWWPPNVAKAEWDGCNAEALKMAISAFIEKCFPVYIWGPTRTGKTCLSALICSRSPVPRMIATDELLDQIMTARRNGEANCHLWDGGFVARTEWQIFSWCHSASILCLDDVGTTELTAPQMRALLQVVNSRQGRPLILTSNINPDRLKEYVGQRIASRMLGGQVIYLGAK